MWNLTRREMLQRSSAGFGSLALASLLAETGQGGETKFSISSCSQSETSDFSVHEGWPFASRYVRL